MLAARGIPVDQFAPRLSFFLDCGLDVEYIALARVSRRIWAIGMRDVFCTGPKGQMFKLHTQTSGRSLVAAEFKNNLTRTAAELMLAYMKQHEQLPLEQRGTSRSPRRAKSGSASPLMARRSCSMNRAFLNTP